MKVDDSCMCKCCFAGSPVVGLLVVALATLPLIGCVTNETTSTTRSSLHAASSFRTPVPKNRSFDGVASYYSESQHVASGARFEPNAMTAAHRSLPFGTRVRVRDLNTKRSVDVVINDRGPFVRGRVLDLSVGAARALGIQGRGVSHVHAVVLNK